VRAAALKLADYDSHTSMVGKFTSVEIETYDVVAASHHFHKEIAQEAPGINVNFAFEFDDILSCLR